VTAEAGRAAIRVSVVIPTYRRPELLRRCLDALTSQDFDARDYEVIVVDDEPSSATRETVEAYACRPEAADAPAIRYLARHPDRRGPAAARNLGWRSARGAVIAFTDDDCIPQNGWLRAGVSAIEHGADAVTGRLVVPRPDCPTDYERTIGQLEDSPFVTANCFYRREVLDRLGGFDERFTTAWREDSDLYFSAMESGFRTVRAPGAVVVHPVRAARWGVSIRDQWKSKFNALLYGKHPKLYREQIQRPPPLRYLGIVLALLVTLAGLGVRARRVAAIGGLAWVLQTLAFTRLRLRGTSRRPAHILEMLMTSMVIPPLSLYWRIRGAVQFRVWFL
jgi:glycosyltransferase involved in cell wall biosynthesis